jgi:hypothetical protein
MCVEDVVACNVSREDASVRTVAASLVALHGIEHDGRVADGQGFVRRERREGRWTDTLHSHHTDSLKPPNC